MDHSIADLSASLREAAGGTARWAAIERHFKANGFSSLRYLQVAFPGSGRPMPFAFNSNLPQHYLDRCATGSLKSADPAHGHAAMSLVPMHLGHEFLDRAECDPEVFSFYADLRDIGCHSSIVIPLWESGRGAIRLIQAGCNLKRPEYERYLASHLAELVTAAHLAGDAMLTAEPVNGPLSPREREVLQLLAAGYLNDGIAGRLNLSLPTVKLHIRNARQKLGAKTREMAIARAVKLRLIDPD